MPQCPNCGEAIGLSLRMCDNCSASLGMKSGSLVRYQSSDQGEIDTHSSRGISDRTTTNSLTGKNISMPIIKRGAKFGAISFIINYIIIYLFSIVDGMRSVQHAATWQIAGWHLYGAHNVKTQFITPWFDQGKLFNPLVHRGPDSLPQFVSEQSINPTVQSSSPILPRFLYYLVPVLTLIIAGYLLYSATGELHKTKEAAKIGATITTGYAILALIGIFVFRARWGVAEGGIEVGSISPNIVPAIVVVGILYPVCFGAVGAIIRNETRAS